MIHIPAGIRSLLEHPLSIELQQEPEEGWRTRIMAARRF